MIAAHRPGGCRGRCAVATASARVARVLNGLAAVVLLAGAGWQVVLVARGAGWWRLAVAVGAVLLAHQAVRVARYGPRVRG